MQWKLSEKANSPTSKKKEDITKLPWIKIERHKFDRL